MRHSHQQPPTVAILGASTLVDRILAWLLKHEGNDTKPIEAYPMGSIDELLKGVHVLLFAPYLDADDMREACVHSIRK